MEAKIIKKIKNPFLHREEIEMEIQNEVAPSFAEVKNEIGGNENLTVVKIVKGNFGRQSFSVMAYVYDSVESKDKIETVSKKIRAKMAEEKKKAKEGTN